MSALLIIDAFEKEFVEAAIRMDFAGVSYRPDITRDDLIAARHQAQVLVLKSKTPIDETLLQALPRLRLIIRAGAGLEHVDRDACARRGIRLEATPGANAQAVGEHALGMLLNLLNHLNRADRELRQGIWRREANRGRELHGLTVGLIGYGHTGRAFARVLYGFECTVLAYDKYRTAYSDAFAREASVDDIHARADVLSLHVPLTDETHHLVNEAFLQRFARPLVLLNLARGQVVHTQSLVNALSTGRVVAAGLDVFENERWDTLTAEEADELNALAARDNVALSPHIGGWTVESAQRINRAVLDHLARYLQDSAA